MAYLNIHTTNFPGGEIRGQLAAVPEPSSFVIGGLCALGLVVYGRRRSARLLVNSPAGLSLWLDQTPMEIKEVMPLDLRPGLHTLTFGIDLNQRHEDLRCELAEAPNSSAQARIVGGK